MKAMRCADCCRFTSLKTATVDFTPDSHFGPEIIEYVCPKCQAERQELAAKAAPKALTPEP